MNVQNVDLSALISTRICHDLINPIGAISNGLQLLDAIGTAPGPELSLLNDSTSAATAKINVFRLAFGDASNNLEIQNEKIAKLINDMYEGGRVTVDWTPTEKGFARQEVKLCFLTLFCIESSLPLGGQCRISRNDNFWNFHAQGRRTKIQQELWDMLMGNSGVIETSASDVHFLVGRLTAEQSSKSISMSADDTNIRVEIEG